MKTQTILLVLLIAVGFAAGCKRAAKAIAEPKPAMPSYQDVSSAVRFTLSPEQKQPDGSFTWEATYKGAEGSTKFKFNLVSPQKGAQISFGKGEFLQTENSDATPLLKALKAALEAKNMPTTHQHVPSLKFTYAVLGNDMVRDDSGSYAKANGGTWIAMKLFLPQASGDNDAEVYFNLSAATGQGEFSIKDPDYGDDVLKDLANVL